MSLVAFVRLSCRAICLVIAHLLLGLALPASAAEPARVQLAAWRVQTVVQDGAQAERLVDLTQLRPGDTIESRPPTATPAPPRSAR